MSDIVKGMADVCVWTRISEYDTVMHYSTPHGVMNDLNLWRGLQCSICHNPIKFKEAAAIHAAAGREG